MHRLLSAGCVRHHPAANCQRYLLHPATRNIRYAAAGSISRYTPQYIFESSPALYAQRSCFATMAIEVAPLPLPPSALRDQKKNRELARKKRQRMIEASTSHFRYTSTRLPRGLVFSCKVHLTPTPPSPPIRILGVHVHDYAEFRDEE